MYTAKNKNKNLDRVTMVIGVLMPIFTVPQLITVLLDGTDGVSIVTWAFYSVQGAIFAAFGIRHKETPLIVAYIPFFLVAFSILCTVLIKRHIL